MCRRLVATGVMGLAVLAWQGITAARADEAGPSAATTDEIRRWIADLDADSFAVRDAAQKNLYRAGRAAIGPLIETTAGADPETRSRSVALLKRFAATGDGATAGAANEALGRLASSEDLGTARAARDAIAALDQAARAKQVEQLRTRRLVRPRGAKAMIRIEARVVAPDGGTVLIAGGGVRSMETTVINGRRTIKSRNPTEDVEITDGGDDGITIAITRKADGGKEKKPTTEKFTAKDAKELEEKHPEAYKTYQKYAGDKAGGIVVIGDAAKRPAKAGGPPRAPEPPTAPDANHVDVPLR